MGGRLYRKWPTSPSGAPSDFHRKEPNHEIRRVLRTGRRGIVRLRPAGRHAISARRDASLVALVTRPRVLILVLLLACWVVWATVLWGIPSLYEALHWAGWV